MGRNQTKKLKNTRSQLLELCTTVARWRKQKLLNKMQNDQHPKQNLNLAFQVISCKLERQSSAHTSLEAKIGILLGFVGVIIAGAITLMQGQFILMGRNFLTLGLFGLGMTLFLLILASRTRIFFDPPDFPAFYSQETLNTSEIEFKNKIIADMIESYKRNAIHHSRKAHFYDGALWTFFSSLILIFTGVL